MQFVEKQLAYLPHLWPTLIWLAGLVGLAVFLGGIAKTDFMKKLGKAFSLPLIVLFGGGVYNAINLWCDARYGSVPALLTMIFMVVFLTGGSLVAFQDISYQNGRVAIKQDSLAYKWLIDPLDVGEIIHRRRLNLCSTSWLIIGANILVIMVLALFALVGIVGSLFLFLVLGCNPVTNLAGWFSKGIGYAEFEEKELKFWGKVPLSPLLFFGVVGAGYGIYQLFSYYPGTMLVIALGLVGAGVAAVVLWLVLAAPKPKRTLPATATGIDQATEGQRVRHQLGGVKSVAQPTFWEGISNGIRFAFSALKALKGKVCPEITTVE